MDRKEAERKVQAYIDEARIPVVQKERWVQRVINDASVLDDIAGLPQILPGVEAINHTYGGVRSGAARIEVTGVDPRHILPELERHIGKGPDAVTNALERGINFATVYTANRDRILPVLNASTNTISTDLKRTAIMQETISAFSRRLLAMRLFSTVFESVPLKGDDTVTVPYYPLRTDASTDWNPANGYVASGTAEVGAKKIAVNKRKYQPLDYSSSEFQRQPHWNTVELTRINAEKLANDILLDILSCVTFANFGDAVLAISPAAATDDDIADLKTACDLANWPDAGRGLLVNSALDNGLMKDPAFKNAMNFGSAEVIREGRLQHVRGFDYAMLPGLPTNAEKLVGAAVFRSAILAAFSPVDPAPGVMARLYAYQVIVDPQTGIAMNYRHWGDAQKDRDMEVVEAAYGYQVGEGAALKRVCEP